MFQDIVKPLCCEMKFLYKQVVKFIIKQLTPTANMVILSKITALQAITLQAEKEAIEYPVIRIHFLAGLVDLRAELRANLVDYFPRVIRIQKCLRLLCTIEESK